MQGARIDVRLQPRASRDEIVGIRDGVLHARVTAPPVGGEANRALCRLIAARLGIAGSRVEIVRGQRGRSKVVAVAGMSAAELASALG
ncbi:MAG TPA: DUF167 domain-containing protein [Solirubrobacteraceae bacterium]